MTIDLQGRRGHPGKEVISAQELTTQCSVLPAPSVDNQLLAGFRDYLLGKVSEGTTKDYVNVVGKRVCLPEKRSHVKAWRQYIQYLFSVGRISWEEWARYLEFLKLSKPRRKVTEEVPVKLIQEYREHLLSSEYRDLYYLLLGGARLRHVVLMLETWSPMEKVKHPMSRFEPRLYCTKEFCRYHLERKEGGRRGSTTSTSQGSPRGSEFRS